MRLAIYGQPTSYTKKEITIDIEYYIDRGVDVFDFLSYGDFELMTAQIIRELQKKIS